MTINKDRTKRRKQSLISSLMHRYPNPPYSLSHSLWRASEAFALQEIGWKAPILDLGCGDAAFSSTIFNKIDVGLELSREKVKKAHKSGVYDSVVIADGTKMPFRGDYFGSIFSNSVIEHIPEYRGVLKEVHRTLKPNGIFVYTVPSEHLDSFLLVPQLLRPLRRLSGARKVIEWYVSRRKKSLLHVNILSPSEWFDALSEAKLQPIKIKHYLSQKTIFVWDLLCIISNKMKLSLFIPRRILLQVFVRLSNSEVKKGGAFMITAKKVIHK